MASSGIKRPTHWGTEINPTLPFTAPCDGLMFLNIQANSTGTSYDYWNWTTNVNGTLTTRLVITSNTSSGNTTLLPMRKGDTLEQGASSNLNSANSYIRFIPME